jgi:hypothetical protein
MHLVLWSASPMSDSFIVNCAGSGSKFEKSSNHGRTELQYEGTLEDGCLSPIS